MSTSSTFLTKDEKQVPSRCWRYLTNWNGTDPNDTIWKLFRQREIKHLDADQFWTLFDHATTEDATLYETLKKEYPKVTFLKEQCSLQFGKYENYRTSISLVSDLDGSPHAKCTINLMGQAMAIDEVGIKNYAENEGMLQALIEAGVIAKPHRHAILGFIENIPVCRLLVTPPTT